MNLVDTGRTVLRLHYQVASLPLRIVEQQSRRLGAASTVHLLAERIVATLDGGVGQILDDPGLRRQGERSGRQADSLSRADQLERDARNRRVEAERERDQAAEAAETRRERAREQQRERITSTVEQQRADQKKVSARVREDAENARQAADAKAEAKAKRARTVQRKTEQGIESRTEQVTAEPKQELKAAAAQRKQAATHSRNAEDLDELAEQEQAERRGTAGNPS